jgi:thiol:disulfide interchange protein
MSSFAHNNQQQLLSSFSSTSQHLSMPPAFTGSQTDSFGFNQNDFVQQVVTMSAIKELQHEDEPLSSSSVVEEAPAVDHDAVAVETEAAAVVLNESVCSDAAACTRTELSAVRVAAGWESAENNENIQLNDSASAAALAVKTSAAAVDSAVVTNEHSPSHTPRNNATSNDSKQQNTPTVRRPGCFGGLCGGSSRRQPTPANRF